MVSVLLKYLPQEILDSIMMYLDTKDIRRFGRKCVSEYVWLRKKDKNWTEACVNKNVIGFQYIIEQSAGININFIFREIIQYECFDIIKYCIKQNAYVDFDKGYALKYYSYRNNLDVVRYLVEECGSDIYSYINNWEINRMAANGSLDVIKYFVDWNGVDIQTCYYSILRSSAENGHLNIIEYCVGKGANLYIRNNGILRSSAENGHLDIIQYYLENNSIVNNDNTLPSDVANNSVAPQTSEESEFPAYMHSSLTPIYSIYNEIFNALVIGAENGNLDIIKLCMECFTNVHANTDDNNTVRILFENKHSNSGKYRTYVNINKALHYSIENDHIAVAKYLALCGTKEHVTINAALRVSLEYGNLRFIKYLVKNGADISIDINTRLQSSITSGHLNVVRYLITNGAKLSNIDKILECNMKNYSTSIIRYLIENCGVNRDVILLSSIKACRFIIVKYFIKCGVDINTILKLSVENNSYSIVKHITKDKAYKNAALQFCIEYGNLYITKRLVWYGVDINANNNAALLSCVKYDRSEIMRFLIRNSDKDKTIQFSIEHGNLFILKYIVNYHRINLTENNNAALCSGIKYGNINIIQYLIRETIKNGTDISVIHNDKYVKFKTVYKHIIEYVSNHVGKLSITNSGIKDVTITIDENM
jgi:hypothetical protein